MILFAVDLHEPRALTDAVTAFAEQVGQPLLVLHVTDVLPGATALTPLAPGFDPSLPLPLLPGAVHEIEAAGASALRRFAEERFPDGTRVATKAGPAAEIVLEVARDLGAAFIALGHRERGFFDAWLSGSTAVSVVRHAPCPVVVFPSPSAR